MIHWDERYVDVNDINVEKLQYWRYRRQNDPGEKLWRLCTWVLTGLLAVLLFAAQVH